MASTRKKAFFFQQFKSLLLLFLGVFLAGFGLKGFVLPNNFLDGGAMGISLLLYRLVGFDLAFWIFIVNLPFVFLSIWQVSRGFALRTLLAIGGLALILELFPFSVVTHDKLLVAVFGGFFLGAGIGLAIRGNGVLDGTEVLAFYLSRNTILSVGEGITLINLVIFSFAAWLISLETALYAMLTYFFASRTVDFVLRGLEGYTSVFIISMQNEAIRQMILEKMGRGVTVFKAEKGLEKTEMNVLYTVITRLEVVKLQNEIRDIDDRAFIIQQRVDDTKGGMIRQRKSH
ncbi:MAG: YitT family protein [Microscillaceae bacterium]|nr:YitT family protein [Microscillaceae bacterium]